MIEPFRECPQFESCSCNGCPLDPAQGEREALEGDEPCLARRATRVAIVARYPELALDGLLHAERVRDRKRAKWLALPEAERLARTAHLRPFALKHTGLRTSTPSDVDLPESAPAPASPVETPCR